MPPSSEPSFTKDFVHFKQHVAQLFQKEGWTVETTEQNPAGYDFVVKKGNQLALSRLNG
jgi:hypothetical protein